MKTETIRKAYELARERYAEIGIDTDKVLERMDNFHLSLHCWQADDVVGFEPKAGALSGGIQTTGNYPGRARNIEELRADILKALSLIPGTHRLNLHAIYGDFKGEFVDRDQITIEHFQSWIDWALANNIKLDFNSSSFSHPKSGDLSLSNPDDEIRKFWIEHTKRCRAIAEEIGKAQGDPCIMNLWVHDGSKDITVNRYLYRKLFKESLDEIFATKYDNMASVSKVSLPARWSSWLATAWRTRKSTPSTPATTIRSKMRQTRCRRCSSMFLNLCSM